MNTARHTPLVHENADYELHIGKGIIMRPGTDATIIATGIMVHHAIVAADQLSGEGIKARVVNMHTIKPLDRELIIRCAGETGAIVTAEEHSIVGGLGGAVAEVLGENKPVPMARVGMKDMFGESGKPEELLEKYGLTSKDISSAVRNVIKRK